MEQEAKKNEEVIDETRTLETTELLIALPALLKNIESELKLSQDMMLILANELSIAIIENKKLQEIIEKIDDLFVGGLDEKTVDSLVEKVTEFFSNKESILADENQSEVPKIKTTAQINKKESPIEDIQNLPSATAPVLDKLSQSFTTPSAIIPKKSVYTEASSVASSAPTAPTLGGPKSLADALPLSGTPKAAADPYRVDPTEE